MQLGNGGSGARRCRAAFVRAVREWSIPLRSCPAFLFSDSVRTRRIRSRILLTMLTEMFIPCTDGRWVNSRRAVADCIWRISSKWLCGDCYCYRENGAV